MNPAVVATGQTSVVISNLAYLVGAVVLAIVIISVVAIRHRRPRSTEEDMSDFHRGLAALDPDRGGRQPSARFHTRRRATRVQAPTPLQPPRALQPQRTERFPVKADGSTPRRPSTRSKSG